MLNEFQYSISLVRVKTRDTSCFDVVDKQYRDILFEPFECLQKTSPYWTESIEYQRVVVVLIFMDVVKT